MAIVSERRSHSFKRIRSRCRSYLDSAVEKPTATFDLMSMCVPHFASLGAKLVEAINTLFDSRDYYYLQDN